MKLKLSVSHLDCFLKMVREAHILSFTIFVIDFCANFLFLKVCHFDRKTGKPLIVFVILPFPAWENGGESDDKMYDTQALL